MLAHKQFPVVALRILSVGWCFNHRVCLFFVFFVISRLPHIAAIFDHLCKKIHIDHQLFTSCKPLQPRLWYRLSPTLMLYYYLKTSYLRKQFSKLRRESRTQRHGLCVFSPTHKHQQLDIYYYHHNLDKHWLHQFYHHQLETRYCCHTSCLFRVFISIKRHRRCITWRYYRRYTNQVHASQAGTLRASRPTLRTVCIQVLSVCVCGSGWEFVIAQISRLGVPFPRGWYSTLLRTLALHAHADSKTPAWSCACVRSTGEPRALAVRGSCVIHAATATRILEQHYLPTFNAQSLFE